MTAPVAPVALFCHEGEQLDYTPAAAISAGDVVVLNDVPTVSPVDIAASAQGAVNSLGVFIVPKAAVAFAALQRVYWDLVNKVATNDPTLGPLMGRAELAQVSGDASVRVLVGRMMSLELYYALLAAGAALTNSTVETTLGSANFPANRLVAGDVIRFRAQGIATLTNSTDTLNVKAYLGANNLCATGALDVANNDIFYVEGDIVVRTAGAGGTIVAAGSQSIGTPGTATVKNWNFASAGLDTTAAQLFKLTGTWSVANAGDSCRLDLLDIELKRQQ